MKKPKPPLRPGHKIVTKKYPNGTQATYVVKGFRSKVLTDMSYYFRSVDWAEYWEEWFLGVKPDGSRKYIRLRDFIAAHAESKEQETFLIWYLGPETENSKIEGKDYLRFAPAPVDWIAHRKSGGWFTNANMRLLSADITRRMNALECLREAGNKVSLHAYLRAGQLAAQIDEAFKGAIFLPGLTMNDNAQRAKLYMELQERALKLQGKAQSLYARSHGVNFDDMAGLVKIMEASALSAQQQALISGAAETPVQAALRGIVEMTVIKAHRYGLKLPPDAEAKIVDAVTDVEEVPEKKKKVQ